MKHENNSSIIRICRLLLICVRRFAFAVFMLCMCFPCFAKEWTGKVVQVIDGTTIKVQGNSTTTLVRLEDIESPSLGQPFGTRAMQATKEMCLGKTVVVYESGKDEQGRTLANVNVVTGNQYLLVNSELISKGLAWWHVTKKDRNYFFNINNPDLAKINLGLDRSERELATLYQMLIKLQGEDENLLQSQIAWLKYRDIEPEMEITFSNGYVGGIPEGEAKKRVLLEVTRERIERLNKTIEDIYRFAKWRNNDAKFVSDFGPNRLAELDKMIGQIKKMEDEYQADMKAELERPKEWTR